MCSDTSEAKGFPETFGGGSGENRWRQIAPEPKTHENKPPLQNLFHHPRGNLLPPWPVALTPRSRWHTLPCGGRDWLPPSMQPPKLPWAVPTVTVGNAPGGVAVDPATDTIYVTNIDDGTISVIDGRKCNARNASRCAPIATMTNAGLLPPNFWITFDQTSGTLYVTNGLTATGDDGNTITVLNGRTCNARNTSGCGQTPAATVTVPGVFFNQETEAFSILGT